MKYILFLISLYCNSLIANEYNKFSIDYTNNIWPEFISDSNIDTQLYNSGNSINGFSKNKNHLNNLDIKKLPIVISLQLPIDKNIINKKGVKIDDFNKFYGIKKFIINDRKKLIVKDNYVIFILKNHNNEEYKVKISSVKSYAEAWKDFAIDFSYPSSTANISNTGPLFQKSSFDGFFSLINLLSSGVFYVIPYGPYSIDIQPITKEKMTKMKHYDLANRSMKEKLSDFSKHEANIAYIAREINSIIKMETPMPSKESLGINQ